MAVFDGKRNPDGVLSLNQAGPGASTNSVNVGRGYGMLEVSLLMAGGGTATIFLQRRGELSAGGTRVADCNGWVNVTDANCPVAGIGITATAISGTFRVRYPRGEYQINATALTGGTVTMSYALTGEAR